MANRADLDVISGPMFSGKTESLIGRFHKAVQGGAVVVALKPSRDTRHPKERVVSHTGRSVPARTVNDLKDMVSAGADADVVVIDEVQFFEPELADVIDQLRTRGTRVIAAGLDLDFKREPFITTEVLERAATRVERLEGICSRCGQPATLTQRLIGGTPAPFDSPRFVVGNRELYEPRCESCWIFERR